MKIVRFRHEGEVVMGSLEGEHIQPLEGPLDALRVAEGRDSIALADVQLLSPVHPNKVIAIGPGYRAMLEGRPQPARPYYWLKPASAVQHPEGEIVLRAETDVSHESEIGIIIGRRASRVSREQAADHILGYTCVNDVTAGPHHDIPNYMTSQYFVDGKALDTYAPVGPVVVTDLDPSDLRIQCRVNGKIIQDHRTSDRIWDYDELVSMISHVMTLDPGDIIATGSPPGVEPMNPGDVVEVEVEGIGVLRNHAVAAPAMPTPY